MFSHKHFDIFSPDYMDARNKIWMFKSGSKILALLCTSVLCKGAQLTAQYRIAAVPCPIEDMTIEISLFGQFRSLSGHAIICTTVDGMHRRESSGTGLLLLLK